MEIGKRNRRITILDYQNVKTEEGAYINQWVELCKVWAYIKPLSGSEVYVSQADEHKATVKINIRYNKQINDTMQIKIDNVTYKIGYIEDVDFSHKEMWLTLEKVI